jgi:hypothetical protein
MHPIERLRYVARASGVPQAVLVREAAGALASFSREPQGLVTACRRMLARQPGSGPLLWLGARVLAASDPLAELRRCMDALDDDPTGTELRYALPDGATVAFLGWPDVAAGAVRSRGDLCALVIDTGGEGSGFVQRLWDSDIEAVDIPLAGMGAAVAAADLLVLESPAIGPTECLAVSGSHAAAAVAHHRGIPVWLVGGVGRLLPGPMWNTLRSRSVDPDDPWDDDDEIVPLDLVSHIVGPTGPTPTAEALQELDCPVIPELLV